MRVPGDEHHVNVDSARGSLEVVLTDEGHPLLGYASTPITVDQTDALVRFGQSLGALTDRNVRVRL